jgi:periplasmic mercuric ion binding protein
MKTRRFSITAITVLFISAMIWAQPGDQQNPVTLKTEKLKVGGNCDMCKARIEKAAKVNGVTKADWNKETKILTLTYDSKVVTSDEVQKKIAAVGHDTPKYKADDKAYNSLPGCCKYR